MTICEWDAPEGHSGLCCVHLYGFVSYRRLSPPFQFSLSGATLVYLSQWCGPHPVRGLKLLHEPYFYYLQSINVFQHPHSVWQRHTFNIKHLKGHGNEADFLGILQKSVPHESLILPFEPFRFRLQIRGDIRNRVGESANERPCVCESVSRRLPDSSSRGADVR
jgi:hypothetical protein